MESSLKTMIEAALNIPVTLDGENMIFPCATIQIRESASEGLYGDGKNEESIAICQIDLWYEDRTAWKTAESTLKTRIKSQITAPEVSFSGYDTYSAKYRTTFTFNALSA